MEEKKTIFDFLMQVLMIFGITMAVMMCFTVLFGESAAEISAFFTLGKQGVPVPVMAQFLGMSTFVTLYRYLFFTNWLIKKMGTLLRTILMVGAVIVTIIGFIVIFDWFPVRMWQPWAMFFLCFGVCFAASTVLTLLKTRLENKRLEEGLERIKKQWKEQDENESDNLGK